MITFEGWPKTQRLSNTTMAITEKIDGTNACVVIEKVDVSSPMFQLDPQAIWVSVVYGDGTVGDFQVAAQSRKRLIAPASDNFGFAGWVWDNAAELVDLLGPGRHFGEWWGQGIQRRYGMDRKVFSLFNQHRWSGVSQERDDWFVRAQAINMTWVPLLYAGKLELARVDDMVDLLREEGSLAAAQWGFAGQKAEGVVTYFPYLDVRLKSFLENDDVPKGE